MILLKFASNEKYVMPISFFISFFLYEKYISFFISVDTKFYKFLIDIITISLLAYICMIIMLIVITMLIYTIYINFKCASYFSYIYRLEAIAITLERIEELKDIEQFRTKYKQVLYR